MDTETLIARLSSEMRIVPHHALERRIGSGLLIGVAVTAVLVTAGLGIRPDLASASQGFAFWMKWSYTSALSVGAMLMVARLARPEPAHLSRFWPIVMPFVALAALSVVQLLQTPPPERLAMWLGATWKICPLLVFFLSLPIFAGLTWSFRRLAATRLRVAGATVGFAASTWAATLYCLHCPEASAVFVLSWYNLGIMLATASGAIVGPRLLRW